MCQGIVLSPCEGIIMVSKAHGTWSLVRDNKK